MKLLLTAFEPFDGTGLNSSLEAARAYLTDGAPDDLQFGVLPVRYDDDTRVVDDLLATWDPDAILHLGQGGGGRVRVERLAVNVRYESSLLAETGPDAPQRRIREDGPAAYFATAPVDEIAAAIQRRDVPACISNHAGVYLCNQVLYQSLDHAARSGSTMRVGFVHLPPLLEQVERRPGRDPAPPLSLEDLTAAVAAAVDACRGASAAR